MINNPTEIHVFNKDKSIYESFYGVEWINIDIPESPNSDYTWIYNLLFANNIKSGIYDLYINKFKNVLGDIKKPYFISEISSSRKEIKINSLLDIDINEEYNFENLYIDNIENRLNNFYLNFGKNIYFKIINWERWGNGFIIKLVDPLDNEYDLTNTCWVSNEWDNGNGFIILNDYDLIPDDYTNDQTTIEYVTPIETENNSNIFIQSVTWDQISTLITNNTSNVFTQILNEYVGELEFIDFIHFGSASYRLHIFKQKIDYCVKNNTPFDGDYYEWKLYNKLYINNNFNSILYSSLLNDAIDYDKSNIHCLVNFLPSFMVNEFEQNNDFFTLVYMTGNYFDDIRLQINNIFKLFKCDDSKIINNKELLDIKFKLYGLTIDNFKIQDETYDFKKYTEGWNRIVNNIHKILKYKDTIHYVNHLLSCLDIDPNFFTEERSNNISNKFIKEETYILESYNKDDNQYKLITHDIKDYIQKDIDVDYLYNKGNTHNLIDESLLINSDISTLTLKLPCYTNESTESNKIKCIQLKIDVNESSNGELLFTDNNENIKITFKFPHIIFETKYENYYIYMGKEWNLNDNYPINIFMMNNNTNKLNIYFNKYVEKDVINNTNIPLLKKEHFQLTTFDSAKNELPFYKCDIKGNNILLHELRGWNKILYEDLIYELSLYNRSIREGDSGEKITLLYKPYNNKFVEFLRDVSYKPLELINNVILKKNKQFIPNYIFKGLNSNNVDKNNNFVKIFNYKLNDSDLEKYLYEVGQDNIWIKEYTNKIDDYYYNFFTNKEINKLIRKNMPDDYVIGNIKDVLNVEKLDKDNIYTKFKNNTYVTGIKFSKKNDKLKYNTNSNNIGNIENNTDKSVINSFTYILAPLLVNINYVYYNNPYILNTYILYENISRNTITTSKVSNNNLCINFNKQDYNSINTYYKHFIYNHNCEYNCMLEGYLLYDENESYLTSEYKDKTNKIYVKDEDINLFVN